MRVYKITWIFVLAPLFASCWWNDEETVSKQEYDEIYEEYQLLKESLDATQTSNLNQAATINKTLTELAEISGSTLVLRTNIEKGTAHVTQAELISNNIQSIKNKISALESQIGNDSAYKKMVENLKTIVREKEAEINSLKAIIESQKETIQQQTTTITEQGEQISKQQELLKRAVVVQSQLLYQAAKEFEEIAEEVPDVSRKKNQKKVDNWAVTMLNSALIYYQKSQEYGNDCSVEIARVKRKIVMLRTS